MNKEILYITNLKDAEKELNKLNVEKISVSMMAPKAVFRVIKLYDVNPAAANIIKQEILAVGGEAAVARGCINMSVDKSDVILMGTLKQYKKLIAKLRMQKGYFGLNDVVKELDEIINDME